MRRFVPLLLLVGCVSATPPISLEYEAISLLGKPLVRPPLSAEVQREREELLAAAQRAYEQNPRSADAIIWLGRRTAYLGRHREAIEIFSRGLRLHPRDPRMLRHRGHRYITTRQIDRAIADLERAASLIAGQPDHVEPDGLPNPRKIPTSTLHFNVWYHLGLGHYLRGDLERAADAYGECLKVSNNPDSLVATTHWYYMTLRRLGRSDQAQRLLDRVDPNIQVIENDSYRRLVFLYKGLLTAESLLEKTGEALDQATIGYGVGNWHLYGGRPGEARRVFERVIEAVDWWPAFGFIAAEAELARMGR